MITSVFRKSTPLNFSLGVILILVFFSLYQIQDLSWTNSYFSIAQKAVLVTLLLGSTLLTNFIARRNEMSKDSCYTLFFYFLFLLFVPSVFNNSDLIISNFFVLLALRRIVSLHSLKDSKEKIFDASLWIFAAALFQFWSILFIIPVFMAIIVHVSGDYRNWVLPFIALFTVITIFLLYAIAVDLDVIDFINTNIVTNFELNYFTNNYQNAAFSIYLTVALFFLISMLVTLPNRPLILHTSFKKMITSFFIGIIIFVISPNKSNDLLLFSFGPLAVMATGHIEWPQLKLRQEIVLWVIFLCSLWLFFAQL